MSPFEGVEDNPDRVIVFVQKGDRTHGWEVFDATASYRITGYPAGSAHAQIVVEGEFHRIMKSTSSMQIEDRMRQRLTGAPPELEE